MSGAVNQPYCRLNTVNSEIFARIFFANSVKRHICDVKIGTMAGLTLSVNDRVVSPFYVDFIFTKLRMCEVLRK